MSAWRPKPARPLRASKPKPLPVSVPPIVPVRKPQDYRERRAWQNAARDRGEVPLCGREACPYSIGSKPWYNPNTTLLYCPICAAGINRYNPGLCTLETV